MIVFIYLFFFYSQKNQVTYEITLMYPFLYVDRALASHLEKRLTMINENENNIFIPYIFSCPLNS